MRERWNSDTKKWEPIPERVYDYEAVSTHVSRDEPFTSVQLPRNWADADGKPLAPDYEPGTGKPRFNSKREAKEAVRRHNGEQDAVHMAYGELPLVDGTGQ